MESFAFVVVPYERTTSYMKGAAEGPGAFLRDWEFLTARGEVPSPAQIVTIPGKACGSPRGMISAVESAVSATEEEGLLPILLGGEHTAILGAVSSLARRPEKMGVIQFDAHADLRESYQGSRYSHASVMRRVVDDLALPLLPVGIRALSREEANLMKERNIGSIPGRCLPEWRKLLPPLLKRLPERVYLTIDMDYFDPSVVPGVGTPEPGGGEWYETLDLIEAVTREKRVAGFDIVELCPPREKRVSVRAATRLAAALLSKVL